MSVPRVPLVPRAGLHLFVWSWKREIGPDEVERFVRLFREVWAGIFASDRRAILRYWRKARLAREMAMARERAAVDADVECVISAPSIQFCTPQWKRGQGLTRASAGLDGTELKFDASRLPRRDAGARADIAHELGHVRLNAAGCDSPETRPVNRCPIDYCLSPVEAGADILAAAWGFRPKEEGQLRIHEGVIKRTPSHPVAAWLSRWRRNVVRRAAE